MGYDITKIEIGLRIKKDNGPRQAADEEALQRLGDEIRFMIEADPDYSRIACAHREVYP